MMHKIVPTYLPCRFFVRAKETWRGGKAASTLVMHSPSSTLSPIIFRRNLFPCRRGTTGESIRTEINQPNGMSNTEFGMLETEEAPFFRLVALASSVMSCSPKMVAEFQ